jgi:RES domain-containing protein
LANSEVAVHIPLAIMPKDYYMLEIEIPDSIKVLELDEAELPTGWNAIPCLPVSQRIGDGFARENKFVVMQVPSVVVKGEYNFVLNPRHKDFKKIKIIRSEPFPFDPRLFEI